jgi:hypothetical protein
MGKVRLVLQRQCTEAPRFEERDGGRWCHGCATMQYDLRGATRSEAVALMRAHGGHACARVRIGSDGAPKFVPERPARGVTAIGAAFAMALAACESPPEPSVAPVAVETPPPTSAPPTTVAAPPPTTEAPPPPTSDAAIDHTTDASPVLEDHQQHRHRHAPVRHVSHEDWGGEMGLDGL